MMPEDLCEKVDTILAMVQEQNVKIGTIDGKVDIMNDRINTVDARLLELYGTVMRREGSTGSEKDVNKKMMWVLSYCIALCGVFIALLKFLF